MEISYNVSCVLMNSDSLIVFILSFLTSCILGIAYMILKIQFQYLLKRFVFIYISTNVINQSSSKFILNVSLFWLRIAKSDISVYEFPPYRISCCRQTISFPHYLPSTLFTHGGISGKWLMQIQGIIAKKGQGVLFFIYSFESVFINLQSRSESALDLFQTRYECISMYTIHNKPTA